MGLIKLWPLIFALAFHALSISHSDPSASPHRHVNVKNENELL